MAAQISEFCLIHVKLFWLITNILTESGIKSLRWIRHIFHNNSPPQDFMKITLIHISYTLAHEKYKSSRVIPRGKTPYIIQPTYCFPFLLLSSPRRSGSAFFILPTCLALFTLLLHNTAKLFMGSKVGFYTFNNFPWLFLHSSIKR